MHVVERFFEHSRLEISANSSKDLCSKLAQRIAEFRELLFFCLGCCQAKLGHRCFPKVCESIFERTSQAPLFSATAAISELTRLACSKFFYFDYHYEKSLDLLRGLSSEVPVVSIHSLYIRMKCYIRKSQIFKAQFRFDDSRNYLKQIVRFSIYFSNEKYTVDALSKLSMIFFNTNDIEEARRFKYKASNYFPSKDRPKGLANLIEMLADSDKRFKSVRPLQGQEGHKQDVSIDEVIDLDADLDLYSYRSSKDLSKGESAKPIILKTHLSFGRNPINHLAFSKQKNVEIDKPPKELIHFFSVKAKPLHAITGKFYLMMKNLSILFEILENLFRAASNRL